MERLGTCEADLQRLFLRVVEFYDCSIIEGHRSLERQHQLFLEDKSHIDGVTQLGNHNYSPSRAVDVMPYPTVLHGVSVWEDSEDARFRFHVFAGIVIGIAHSMQIPIRWGGDWNMDGSRTDQKFHDLPHFELLR